MKTQHTKGEWSSIILDLADYKQCCVGSESSGKVIAHVLIFGDTISEEDVANTKLIAAAPEMLNACFTAKAMYEAQGINEYSRIGGEQYSQLLNTIKKATE